MVLLPPLKVSVSDTSIHGSYASIGPSLMWWESRSQTAPPSTQVRMDLISKKVSIYVDEEIHSSHISSGGPPPFSWPVPWRSPTRNSMRLRGDTGRLNWALPSRMGLYRYTVDKPISSSPRSKWLYRTRSHPQKNRPHGMWHTWGPSPSLR